MIQFLILHLAFAQEPTTPPPTPAVQSAETEARDMFAHGRDAYEHGRYEEAIKKWEEAWRLSRRPLLLANLANAYERLGDLPYAADLLGQYLDLAPEEERDTLQARIAQLEARMKMDEAEEELRQAEEMQRQAAEITENQRKGAAERAAMQTAQRRDAASAPWITGGFAVAGMTLGIHQHVAARATRDALANFCTEGPSLTLCSAEATPLEDQHQRQRMLAFAGYTIGLTNIGATGWLVLRPVGQQVTMGVRW